MAQRTEIDTELNALSVHCRPPIMEVEQRALWLRDWCSDLAEFPIEAIRIACRKYRQSGATKFPTPGQLLPLIRENQPGETTERLSAWRPAEAAEYRDMTVREKIREHQILSHEAYTKAGPMFRNLSSGGSMGRASGQHLAADEMSEAHRHWAAEGLRHQQEAHRLRQHIGGTEVARTA